MLSESLVTSARSVLREETVCRHRGYMRMYLTSSREQTTRDDHPALGLGAGLTAPHRTIANNSPLHNSNVLQNYI
jgi:hypothetical protein